MSLKGLPMMRMIPATGLTLGRFTFKDREDMTTVEHDDLRQDTIARYSHSLDTVYGDIWSSYQSILDTRIGSGEIVAYVGTTPVSRFLFFQYGPDAPEDLVGHVQLESFPIGDVATDGTRLLDFMESHVQLVDYFISTVGTTFVGLYVNLSTGIRCDKVLPGGRLRTPSVRSIVIDGFSFIPQVVAIATSPTGASVQCTIVSKDNWILDQKDRDRLIGEMAIAMAASAKLGKN